MVKGWKEEIEEKENWLSNFDSILEMTLKDAESKLIIGKNKIEKDIAHLKEALVIWTDVKPYKENE